MGVDCVLYALVEGRVDEPTLASSPAFAGPVVVSSIYCCGHGEFGPPKGSGLTIVQCCGSHRYYSVGYPRGKWDEICGAAHWLRATFPGSKVFYGPDNAYWEWKELTEDVELELTRYFFEEGNEEYHQFFLALGINAREAMERGVRRK